MVRLCLLALTTALAAGCYRYEPARVGTVAPGTAVRLHVSDEASRRLEPLAGPATGEFSGELLEWGEDVVLAVDVPAARGMPDRRLRQRLVVRSDEVVAVEVREKDGTRTALLVGGVVAVVAAAAIAALSGVFGGSTDVPGPEVPEGSLVPAWLVPVPLPGPAGSPR